EFGAACVFHFRECGVRRQSAAATALWIIAGTSPLSNPKRRRRCALPAHSTLVVHPQIHPFIKMPNLFGVTIEQERWARSKLADAVLHLLAPARVVDVRIYVRIKPIFARALDVPRRRRLIRN